MKSFHTVAVADKDIIEGKLTMDVFAADLWETYQGRATPEYKDPKLFFEKTYLTKGLNNLLTVVEKRLRGTGGDAVIQIQTPFGGGKTHALIAMYHKAREWRAKPVVIVGTAMDPNEDTLWGSLEKQLTGSMKQLKGNVSPGREAVRRLLEDNQPTLILVDELLEYTTKAAGVPVRETSLAAQTIAFIQELTEVAGTLPKVCVVVTLPSSIIEHYDEKSERLFLQLQKVAGRVERIYTPVQESEITQVIRRRLFSSVDKHASEGIVSEFLEYAEREDILPAGVEITDYRQKFLESYPFLPDVVEVLYHRWGSLPTFQRTRGVLRLLSLVIYSLRESSRPYITLADFDLSNDEIRRELVKHIGYEFDSVIAADITNPDSGSKKVDKTVGKSFQGLRIGTRASVSIFLYSFSGGQEKGAHIGEVKRSATTTENPSSVVSEAVDQLKSKLFFLQSQNDKYFFSNQPNLNRILLTKMENIKDRDLVEVQKETIKQQITGGKLQVFLWPDKPKDIPESDELKLGILAERDEKLMKSIIETKGDTPRVYRNTVLFLAPSDAEKNSFVELLRRKIAHEHILSDKTLNLKEDQRKEVVANVKKDEDNLKDSVKRVYRLAFVPSKTGMKELDLGIPTYGERKGLDEQAYDELRREGEILEKISPLVLKEKYLRDNSFVKVHSMYDSMLKTPGERRPTGPNVIEESIKQGVKQGLFGLGEIQDNGSDIICRFFKEEPLVSSGETEVIIQERLCKSQGETGQPIAVTPLSAQTPSPNRESGNQAEITSRTMKEVTFGFDVPRHKISQVMGIMNYLESKFQSLHMTITAKEGTLTEDEYSNKIREALRQLGVDLEEE
jgi:hypothetical protein